MNGIRGAFSWLGSIVSMCNKELGTPFDRCARVFQNAIDDCRDKLGSFQFLCNIAYFVKLICYALKFLDLICMALDFISDSIVGVVKRSVYF